MRLTIIIELDADGYYASCPELPGCQSQGDTLVEVIEHIGEAIELYQETVTPDEHQVASDESGGYPQVAKGRFLALEPHNM